ncbi:MAG: DUF3467 domain-containing protein [Acidobacteria bacterium]|nr:DUF3467 domain-containing protein [Acidobacteriota bacterium]
MAEFTEHPSEVKIKDSPGQFETYANINGITVTAEEVIFNFGLRNQENPIEAKSVAKIYLGLAHAKRFAIILSQILRDYEQMFGEIEAEPLKRLTKEGKKRLGQVEKPDVSDSK